MLRTNAPHTPGYAEVFLEYDALLSVDDRRAYRARACGGEARDGTNRWQGWIEFLPQGEGSPVRTARETTQPDRTCTVYWSMGLTHVYLEGALERALVWCESGRQPMRRLPHRTSGSACGHPARPCHPTFPGAKAGITIPHHHCAGQRFCGLCCRYLPAGFLDTDAPLPKSNENGRFLV